MGRAMKIVRPWLPCTMQGGVDSPILHHLGEHTHLLHGNMAVNNTTQPKLVMAKRVYADGQPKTKWSLNNNPRSSCTLGEGFGGFTCALLLGLKSDQGFW